MAIARTTGALLALVLFTAACTSGGSVSTVPVPSGALVLKAANIKFSPAHLSAGAGQSFELYFDDADDVQHNVVVLGGDGTRLFVAQILQAHTQRVYHVPALSAGTYKLICDIHSDMTAELQVGAPSN